MDNLSFSTLPISEEILRALGDMGFEEATPIQAETIPYILEGKDLLGQAQTGTGKTCAFGIPVIDSIDNASNFVSTLILSPTRELAIQTAEELHNVAKYKEGVRIVAIYGGQPIDRQILALKRKPQIIVGTPGRVMDHMRRKTLKLDHLEKIVLDEADEMLNMGFIEDIDTILESTPEKIQKIFFSATMPRAIIELTNKYLSEPVHVKIAAKEMTIPLVEQYYIEVREANKVEILSRLIDAGNVSRALVFCNTKRKVDELTDKLNTRGYSVEALHGDMKQASRDRVMKQFKSGKLDLLVATDVAARGIDVDDIEVVFNFDLPSDDEYYIHRVGRTARAGKTGKSYTFVVGREIIDLKNIQHTIKAQITRASIPTLVNVQESRVTGVFSGTSDVLAKDDISDYVSYIDQYVEGLNVSEDDDHFYTTADVAAALLKQLCGEAMTERDEIQEVVPYEEYAKKARKRDMNEAPAPNMRNHGKPVEAGMQRLFLNVGIKDRMRPNQIVQFLASNGDIPGKVIGAIAIFDEFSFVDIPKDLADQVVEKTDGARIGRTPVHVELKRDSAETPAFEKTEPSEPRAFVEKKPYAPRSYADRKPSESGTYSDRKPSETGTYSDRKPSEPRTYGDRKPSEHRTYGDRKPFEHRAYGDRKPSEHGSYGDRRPSEPRIYGDRKPSEPRTYGDRKPSEPRTYGDRKPSEPRTYSDRKPSEPRTYGDRKPAESGSYGEKKKYEPKALGDKKRTYSDKKKPESTDKPRERKKRTE